MSRLVVTLTILLLGPGAVFAQTTSRTDDPLQQMSLLLRPIVIDVLPTPLYQKIDNWGHQVSVPVGVKWSGVRPRVSKSLRNHGEWRRVFISAPDLRHSLELKIYDAKKVNAETQSFKVFLALQMEVNYEQQNWESGVRLWSGSVRARAKVKLYLDCEDTLRIDASKGPLPDFVFRMRVTGAKVQYDNLVFEHINGLGGDAAKLIGKAAHRAMNQWRPSIERDLLAKAGNTVVQSADTREIRVGFGSLLQSK